MTGLLLLFCCWHAGFLIYSIIPAREGRGHPALDLYRLVVGRQQWNMFDTIPAQHSLDLRFEGVDEQGEKITAGGVLPGFQPYPNPEDARYYVLFNRLLFSTDRAAYRDAYLRKAAQLLPGPRGPGRGGPWVLAVEMEYTRTLFHSRRDGQIAMPFATTFEVPSPGGNSP